MDPDAYDIFVFHPEVPWSASQEDSETEESNSEAYSDLEISNSTVYHTHGHEEGCDGCEEPCAVCLENFQEGDSVRVLRCRHTFHTECVDRWLAVNRLCPLCKQEVAPATWKERKDSKDVRASRPSVERVTLVLDFSAMQIYETRHRPCDAVSVRCRQCGWKHIVKIGMPYQHCAASSESSGPAGDPAGPER